MTSTPPVSGPLARSVIVLGWGAVVAAFCAWIAIPHTLAGPLVVAACLSGLGATGAMCRLWVTSHRPRERVSPLVALSAGMGLLTSIALVLATALLLVNPGPGG